MRGILVFVLLLTLTVPVVAQRKVTPVNTPTTAPQPINEFANDTARINARMRESMVHYHDENGNLVYVDTITGKEWRDSTMINAPKPMIYPLLTSLSIDADLWNPVMRVFGQHYGLIGFGARLSMHNRYFPTLESGLGLASNKPEDMNFQYKSPLSVYFRIGADYNFLYNSNPDYQFLVGLRYGFSSFSYSLNDITINSTYWDETAYPTIPSQKSFTGWFEFVIGLRVQLYGPISAGWAFRYHSILHESKNEYGLPWYIPGYGARGTSISGSIFLTYTISMSELRR